MHKDDSVLDLKAGRLEKYYAMQSFPLSLVQLISPFLGDISSDDRDYRVLEAYCNCSGR